jgi:poly-beta-1,6 N-acetyl-D-glucosamine export porin PgaA
MLLSRTFSHHRSALILAWCVLAAAPLRAQSQVDWALQLGEQLKVLEQSPNNMTARKEAWRAAMRLGLFEQAASLGAELDPAERAAMEGDRIALAIRYGRIDAASLTGAARYERLDAALAVTDALSKDFLAGQVIDTEQRRRLYDRVSALVARQRAADAVTLFEALQARGGDAPSWAKSEVAEAYLVIRRPVEAEHLYREVLASAPDNFIANIGLFYALSDQGKADEAITHIDAAVINIPQRRRRDGRANSERLSAEIVGDQARLFAERIPEAQQRMDQHAVEAPFNGELRQAQAGLALARGWPREGEQELRSAIQQDPHNVGLHAERAEVLLGLQRWNEADAELTLARELDDSHPRVLKAMQNFELQERPELYTEAGYGSGENSSPLGSTDWHFDTWIYTPPLLSEHKHSNWRGFVHLYNANAEFNEAMTRWQRTGAGVQWRSGNWQASGEINDGKDFRAGLLGTLRWQPDDHWRLTAEAESPGNDVPMQAVRAKITVNRYALGVDWVAHEARSIGIEVEKNDFSDGNQRKTLALTWFERWYSVSNWLLETRLGGDLSENSLGYLAAYFNPPTDHSIWGSVAVENLFWREYDFSFRQRLVLSAGSYWQEGFGADAIEAIEYEHRWELGPSTSLRYGIVYGRRPYDGDRESRISATASLLWRF